MKQKKYFINKKDDLIGIVLVSNKTIFLVLFDTF